MSEQKLFTVGPVQMAAEVWAAGSVQPPYFRTGAFSEFMLGLERDLLVLMDAPAGARAVFLSSSGTGAMEASLASLATPEDDKLLIIRAGGFGDRFVQLAEGLGLSYDICDLPETEELSAAHLVPFANRGYTAVTVTHCETSNGKLQDLGVVSHFARSEGALTLVDAVSSFLCEPLSMKQQQLDLVLTASQKALALSPGLAPVALSPAAQARIRARSTRSSTRPYYLDLAAALRNMERGQPPYSPAISILQQLRARLDQIDGDLEQELQRVHDLAGYFRQEVTKRTSYTLPSWRLAAGVTLLLAEDGGMETLFTELQDRGFVLNPCGGPVADTRIRVGHMGALTRADYDKLIDTMLTR